MNSKDRIKYSETDLIDVLNRMFNNEELKITEIDFERLSKEATESIIEKIYQFKNDIQRIGYLNYLLKKFFDNGKGYAITSIAKPLQDAFYKKIPKIDEKEDIQYKYIRDCYLVLHHILEEISEHCLVYSEVNFPELLNRNFKVHDVSPFYLFVIYSNPKTTQNNNQNNGNTDTNSKKIFSDYLKNTDINFVTLLKSFLTGKKGKTVSTIIIALKKLELLNYDNFKDFFFTLQSEVGVTGTRQGVLQHLRPYDELTDYNTSISKKDVDKWIVKFESLLKTESK